MSTVSFILFLILLGLVIVDYFEDVPYYIAIFLMGIIVYVIIGVTWVLMKINGFFRG